MRLYRGTYHAAYKWGRELQEEASLVLVQAALSTGRWTVLKAAQRPEGAFTFPMDGS